VIDRHGGTEFQIAGQSAQIRHTFTAHAALTVVFIFVQTMALPARINPIHRNLLHAQPTRWIVGWVYLIDVPGALT
jgi:hypothetical protein